MTRLYGQDLTRAQIAARTGQLAQAGGVRLVELADGVERGVRMLIFRTGAGLSFTVLVDRAFDLHEVDWKGAALSWTSPAGIRHPAFHVYEGEGGISFTRSFSGFNVTCGLDHTLGPAEVPADNYGYPGRKTMTHTLHGRVTGIPARLTGYGETWEGDRCVLWAEGVVRQSTVFGENLVLTRRVEADLGGAEIRISDRVVNQGFAPTPHMFFYHVNVGWPLLAEGTRYIAPISDVVWAAHAHRYRDLGVGYARVGAAVHPFPEQVWEHWMEADASGEVPVVVANDRIGLGLMMVTRKDQLPCAYQWQNFQAGSYAMGIEPSSHHVLGDLAARERGEMIWLRHDEERRYEARFTVLDGAGAIAAAEARVRAVHGQPTDDYPAPSGNFRPLTGRWQP
jgi:hypothetical protein